jgi:hypothetical protein
MATPVAGGLTSTIDGTRYYYYGEDRVFSTVTNAASNQSAQYIEDKWQVTKNFYVTPGLRFENYNNVNGDGQTFLKVENQVNPRLAFAWDVAGNAATKIFGSAGTYGVQIPTHLAVRGASRSLYTKQFFTYTGVDSNGQPIGRVNLGDPYSSNNEYNQPKDPNTVSALNLKPNSQNELTLGIEQALGNKLEAGARFTHRTLVATIDDLCDPRPFEKYAADHNIDTSNWGGFGCASFNPGRANSFLVDYAGNGRYTRVNLSAADLGFEKAKRTYDALDLYLEHGYSNNWYGKLNFTWSKSRGNTEGQTLSDVAQTDVAATMAWDHPELMQGAYGYLPNDRRKQLKAFGFVTVNPQLDIGANLLLATGRPKGCLGNFAGTPALGTTAADFDDKYTYGSNYRYCTTNGVASFAPRGSQGTLGADYRLDMNAVYRVASVKGLKLRLDVFNLLNKQRVQAIDEVHEIDSDPSTISPTYGRVISYSAPRSGRLMVSYDF